MKKIIVTGGAGYIGSHTVTELSNAGYEPIIIDDFSNSEKSVIDSLDEITGKNIQLHEVDITDQSAFEDVVGSLGEIEGVIHFAAFKAVGESVRDPRKYYHNNVTGMLNVLEAMKKFNIPELVFSSSCTVYGQPEQLPVTEESPIVKAESPYGHTKQICEDMIDQYTKHSNGKLKSVILRYFNPIGAHPSALIGELPLGKPENLVPFITQTAAGLRDKLTIFGNDYNTPDGTCIRDYIHVVDLARAHVASISYLSEYIGQEPDIFNLGLGKGFSVKEVVDCFEEITGVQANHEYGPRRSGDVEQIYSASDKANQLLNWKCEYELPDMLAHAWKWQEKLSN